ncbi:MAG: hypothetical protein A2X12_01535 [Bacteroidetes bacterium GWE2_29_8]|nr:MAG: hypothetical protein A2X12_01535 [Bacteroidetes bacterium GWE2_29_8]OFY19947.1 MAG: hypothetical protein A2X02_05360 [Bacteroidetes bacterium GWF2_29_10]
MKIGAKVFLFLISCLVVSCLKKDEYSNIPNIEYESFTKINNINGIDNRGILRIKFSDGDGDIGLSDNDIIYPYDYNLFIKFLEKQKGVWVEPKIANGDDTTYFSFNSRIPIITPVGENKSVKGVIEDTVFINNFLSPFDTICFEIYIKDRALNSSNTIRTTDIIVNKN